jgi:hypothetical protein
MLLGQLSKRTVLKLEQGYHGQYSLTIFEVKLPVRVAFETTMAYLRDKRLVKHIEPSQIKELQRMKFLVIKTAGRHNLIGEFVFSDANVSPRPQLPNRELTMVRMRRLEVSMSEYQRQT